MKLNKKYIIKSYVIGAQFKGDNNLLFKASATGYTPKQIIKTVKRGRKVTITIELESL
ncbi:MAG: hypothetical protein ABI723_19400 [Bacteroidia bacterium]